MAALKLIAIITDIIVIDDGSSDSTDVEAKRAGGHVIRLSQNRGKGEALNAGLSEACANANANDIVALVDSDLGSSAAEFEKLIEPVLKNQVDIPTSGVVTLVFNATSWNDINKNNLDKNIINFPDKDQ